MTNYSNQSSRPGADSGSRVEPSLVIDSPRMTRLVVPELCNVPAVSLLFLFGDRRVKTAMAMGAGPLEESWRRFFPNSQGKHMGSYGHFRQWEAPAMGGSGNGRLRKR